MKKVICIAAAICLMSSAQGCKDDGPEVGRYVPVSRDSGFGVVDTATGTIRYINTRTDIVHEFHWTPRGMTHESMPLKKIENN